MPFRPRPTRRARRQAACAAVVVGAWFAGVAGCGSAEDAKPKLPQMIEVRGTQPSSTTTTEVPFATGTSRAEPVVSLPGSIVGGPTATGDDPSSTGLAPTSSVAAGPPYRVETGTVTLTDSTRGTPARGSTPAATSRTMVTTMYVPVGRPRAPLVVFAIGYNASAAMYDTFVREIAAAGFMVAVPEFPLATSTLPGPPSQDDLPNQPGDISFVISELISLSKQSGAFFNAIDPNRIGIVGHSDGGNTVSAVGLNACCIDPRVQGVVSLAGEKAFLPDTWLPTGTLPYLAIHGTGDPITAYANGKALYDGAGSPKFLVSIEGGDHLRPVQSDDLRPQVSKMVVDFLNFYIDAQSEAYDRFLQEAATPPFRVNQG